MFNQLSPAWTQAVTVVARQELPPDPRVVKSLGHNHTLESALADLVDNSVSANANVVKIRFLRQSGRPVSLAVIDDGDGMADGQLDRAMTLGGDRAYGDGDLGHFGIGLKAASSGQARTLTVLSRPSNGDTGGGRRKSADTEFECDKLAADAVEAALDTFGVATGTVVRWDGVRLFDSFVSDSEANRFLENAILDITHHLGLIFHRFISRRDLKIYVETQEVETGEMGAPNRVSAIDPFAYSQSPDPAFPQLLEVVCDDIKVALRCHIWPPRSTLNGYRLDETDPRLRHQGFHIYRKDRLLQIGGWNSAVHPEPDYILARVMVDLPSDSRKATELFRMNPEKTKVEFSPRFVSAVLDASTHNGASLKTYLARAAELLTDSRKRKPQTRKVVEPGRGFDPRARKSIGTQLEFTHDEPVDIRWTDLDDDEFLDVDHDKRVIWLNRRYREAATGDRGTSLNDAPLVKTLVFLAVEELFQGDRVGSKDKYVAKYLSAVLRDAAKAELS